MGNGEWEEAVARKEYFHNEADQMDKNFIWSVSVYRHSMTFQECCNYFL